MKAEYDRIAWTLRPVNMAHRVLAGRDVAAAAESWRERLREETRDTTFQPLPEGHCGTVVLGGAS